MDTIIQQSSLSLDLEYLGPYVLLNPSLLTNEQTIAITYCRNRQKPFGINENGGMEKH